MVNNAYTYNGQHCLILVNNGEEWLIVVNNAYTYNG